MRSLFFSNGGRSSKRRFAVPILLFILVLCELDLNAQQTVFPLRLNDNGRYLQDRNNLPFLVKEISAWGLIQALSETDESAFVDSVKKKGFNTLMVSIISFDTRFAGNPPDWQGIPPFKTKWDLSSYNIEYFEHVDRFLQMALRKEMLVFLVPCYLGYKDDGNQGWWDELLSPNNNPEKSRLYGEFLGKRYRDFTNIIWEAGGDNKGAGKLFDHMNNIILGIKDHDQGHLWTGHFESAQGTNWSTGDSLYASYMDLDGLYDFTESALGTDGPQYKTELTRYGRGKMIFQLDQSYEHDIPHSSDNEDYQWLRRKNYEGLLSGCAGTSFSPGQKDNPCYTFVNWRPLMNTRGMKEMSYCFALFESRPWHQLVPDQGNTNIARGRGSFGKLDYVCAAISSDHNTLMAYLPAGGSITIKLTCISGKQARAWWFDPLSGNSARIGVFTTLGDKKFTTPSGKDWVLVIDNASLNLPAPGN